MAKNIAVTPEMVFTYVNYPYAKVANYLINIENITHIYYHPVDKWIRICFSGSGGVIYPISKGYFVPKGFILQLVDWLAQQKPK